MIKNSSKDINNNDGKTVKDMVKNPKTELLQTETKVTIPPTIPTIDWQGICANSLSNMCLPPHYKPFTSYYIPFVQEQKQKQFKAFPCDLKELKKYSVANGYLTEQEMLFIWAEMLEQLAYINLKEENELSELIRANKDQYEFSIEYQIFLWKNKQTGAAGQTAIDFISDYFEIPFQNAVATLAKCLGLKLEHIFNIGKVNSESTMFLPKAFQFDSWTFNVLKSFSFSQCDGICLCKINEKIIPLQVGYLKNQPVIGGTRCTHWLNQDLLIRSHTATIALFPDIIAAIDIMEQFQQKHTETEKYVFTACPHQDFDRLDFSFFGYRNVILIYSSPTFPVDKMKSLSKKLCDNFATVKYCDCEIINGKYSMNNINLFQAKIGA